MLFQGLIVSYLIQKSLKSLGLFHLCHSCICYLFLFAFDYLSCYIKHVLCVRLPPGAVRFHPRRSDGKHPEPGDRGSHVSAAQLRQQHPDAQHDRPHAAGEAVQGEWTYWERTGPGPRRAVRRRLQSQQASGSFHPPPLPAPDGN